MIVITNPQTGGVSSDIPIGGIVLWYGSASAVPSGYSICDGTSGNPDIRAKFIRGASSNAELLTTGGSASHLHSGGGSGYESDHSHNFSGTTSANNSYGVTSPLNTSTHAPYGHTHAYSGNTSSDGGHSHDQSGVSSLNNHIPLCKVLYWLKRIS